MSKAEAKKIIERYADNLKKNHYPFEAIYLFGSQMKGKSKEWSDIDVAVISDKLKRNWDQNRFKLWHLRRAVDLRIEPHGFTVEEFKNNASPMIDEIKRTGERVV